MCLEYTRAAGACKSLSAEDFPPADGRTDGPAGCRRRLVNVLVSAYPLKTRYPDVDINASLTHCPAAPNQNGFAALPRSVNAVP